MKWQRKKRNRRISKKTAASASLFRRGGGMAGSLLAGLRRVLLPLGIIVLAVGLWLTLQPQRHLQSLFALKSVQVKSDFKRITSSEVKAVVAPYAGAGFFQLDVDGIQRQLQNLPWVQQASVRRAWPDSLVVTVYEQQPVAQWGDDGLLNASGELFHPPLVVHGDLPRLNGVANSERLLLQRMRDVNEMVQPLGLRVSSMSLDQRRAWDIELDNGLQLKLGREQEIRRIQRFVQFYPRLLALRAADAKVVDLRYPNGFTVLWHTAQVDSVS